MLKRLLASLRGQRDTSIGEWPVPEPVDLAGALRASRLDAANWLHGRLGRRALYTSIGSAALEHLRLTRGTDVAATVRAAERILRHEFNLLGSGTFVPVDPDRPGRPGPDGYRPIDWFLDPVRALRFPRSLPYKAWKLYVMLPG